MTWMGIMRPESGVTGWSEGHSSQCWQTQRTSIRGQFSARGRSASTKNQGFRHSPHRIVPLDAGAELP